MNRENLVCLGTNPYDFPRKKWPNLFLMLNSFTRRLLCSIEAENLECSRILRVAFIGRPNAGKSTLINSILGKNYLSVSDVPHTTQKCIDSYITVDNTQLILSDSPGMIGLRERKRTNRSNALNELVEQHIFERIDLIAVVFDAFLGRKYPYLFPDLQNILKENENIPSILILTKIDKIFRERHLKNLIKSVFRPPIEVKRHELFKGDNDYGGWDKFDALFLVSNQTQDSLLPLTNYFLGKAKPGKFIYPDESGINQEFTEIISQTIREALFIYTLHEIPFKTTINVSPIDTSQEILFIKVDLLFHTNSALKYVKTYNEDIKKYTLQKLKNIGHTKPITLVIDFHN